MKSGSTITFSTSPTPSYDSVLALAPQVLGVHLVAYLAVTGLATAKAIPHDLGKYVVSWIDGSLFALGLGMSGMTSPAKVCLMPLHLQLKLSALEFLHACPNGARAFSQPLPPQPLVPATLQVAQFLDVSSGSWDPSLMFVMGGALALNLPFMSGLIMRGLIKKPMLAPKFSYPTAKQLDSRLLLGGVVFGAGWGLAGVLPAPPSPPLPHK